MRFNFYVVEAFFCHVKGRLIAINLRLRNLSCCGSGRIVRCSVQTPQSVETQKDKSRRERDGSVEAPSNLGRAVRVGGGKVDGDGQGVRSNQQSSQPSTLWTTGGKRGVDALPRSPCLVRNIDNEMTLDDDVAGAPTAKRSGCGWRRRRCLTRCAR